MPTTEAKYSVTFKTATGNLFTVRGDDAAEMQDNLAELATTQILTYIASIQEVLLRGTDWQPAPELRVQSTAAITSQKATEAPQETYDDPFAEEDRVEVKKPVAAAETNVTPKCAHGHRVERAGVSKTTGKPYHGYFCPLQNREEECKAVFA
jgi:hypothetical protein